MQEKRQQQLKPLSKIRPPPKRHFRQETHLKPLKVVDSALLAHQDLCLGPEQNLAVRLEENKEIL